MQQYGTAMAASMADSVHDAQRHSFGSIAANDGTTAAAGGVVSAGDMLSLQDAISVGETRCPILLCQMLAVLQVAAILERDCCSTSLA